MNTETNPSDRRGSLRMPIEREVRYRVLNSKSGEVVGSGKTVNMSSSGVLFATDQILLPGRRVELDVSWPALLDNKCALKLSARGRVVRFQQGFTALEIMEHEFRTKSKKG